jgi:hypothetical protein
MNVNFFALRSAESMFGQWEIVKLLGESGVSPSSCGKGAGTAVGHRSDAIRVALSRRSDRCIRAVRILHDPNFRRKFFKEFLVGFLVGDRDVLGMGVFTCRF